MAIAFNTGTTIDSGGSSVASQAVTIPAGVNSGDVIIVIGAAFRASGAETMQASSTGTAPVIIGSSQQCTAFSSFQVTSAIFSIVATASDAGKVITLSLVSGDTAEYTVALGAWSGASSTSPIDVSGAATASGNGSSLTCPTETTNVANDWDLQFLAAALAGGSYSGPTGFTQREKDISGGGVAAAIYDSNASVGPAGTNIGGANFTNAGNNSWWVGFTVGLAPPTTAAAGGGGVLPGAPGLQSPSVLAVPPRFAIPPAPQQQPAPAPQPVPPGLQSPAALAVPLRPATQAPPQPPLGTPAPQPIPPGLQSPATLAVPARFAIPPAPQQQPAPAPQQIPPGLQSPMSLGVPATPATQPPPAPPPPPATPPPLGVVPPGLQSPMVLAVPLYPSQPAPPQQPPAPAPQLIPPGIQSPMSLAVPATPAIQAPPPIPPSPSVLVTPPGLQSPMTLAQPLYPATQAPPVPPPPAVPGVALLVPPGLLSPMSLGVPTRPPMQSPPPPPLPPSKAPRPVPSDEGRFLKKWLILLP